MGHIILTPMMHPALKKAVKQAGGVVALAKLLGLHRQAIHQWSLPGRRIPADHIVAIERLTGVPRQELRPDLYVSMGLDTPNECG